ncbi:MAG: hypothetical protein IT210_15900 [Armatimonadetes bacterium]|nr:hypothetical protein [Armatimonadota bacterium]
MSQIAARVAPERWQCYTLHEGHKGPLVADITCVRMIAVRERLPGPDAWRVLRRDVLTGEINSFRSNAPADMAPVRLAGLTAARWPVAQCIEEAKAALHGNPYAARSWRGWYHPVTLILIAHLFLVTVQQAFQAQAPALTVPQARWLWQVVLPKPCSTSPPP